MQSNHATQVSSLESEAVTVLAQVRDAFSTLIQAMGGKRERVTDVQKCLGVDAKLSWQVFHVINQSEPLAAAKLIPGEPSIKRLLEAARAHGVPKPVCEQVRAAVAEFNRVVEIHAEDRAEFDFMTSSIASAEAASAAELGVRRTAFRAESSIWGISTETICNVIIVRWAADRKSTDECSMVRKIGFRRLRPDAQRTIFAYRNYGADGPQEAQSRVPLIVKADEQYGVHLLPSFCSQPIPKFRTSTTPDGFSAVDVVGDEIGQRSAVSVAFGHIFRKCPLAEGINGEPIFCCDMRFSTPVRRVISFILVHRPSFGVVQPTLRAFRQTRGDFNPAIAASSPQLPCRERIEYTGVGPVACQSEDLPNNPDMVQLAFDELGWNPADFDTFRLQIEYPVLHSVIRAQFPV